jgi:hypothetical protein
MNKDLEKACKTYLENIGEFSQVLLNPIYIEISIFFFEIVDAMEKLEKSMEEKMDKKIRKIEKGVKKSESELKDLEKADKKRDKVCEYGEMMKKKKNK